MPDNNQIRFLTAISFHGVTSTSTQNSDNTWNYTAEDFVREIDSRRISNAWTDAEAAQHAAGALRGSASKWFHDGLAMHDNYETLKTSWVAFKQVFEDTYRCKKQAKTVNWVDMASQRKTETLTDYMTRVISSMREDTKLTEALTLQAGVVTAAWLETINALTEAQQLHVNNAIQAGFAAGRRNSAKTMFTSQSKQIIASGASDSRIRVYAGIARATYPDDDIYTFNKRLAMHEQTLINSATANGGHPKPATAGNSGNSRRNGKVHEAEGEVDAAGQPKKVCSYCKKKNHTESVCRKKIADQTQQKKSNGTRASEAQQAQPPQPGTSAIMSAEEQACMAALNANGRW